ncbi:MAG TPA: SpoIIE family protein phosphatase [Solirubrobacteraceae bacterium]|nr:SpoIIE family protein phosphatase [Solirubrobacteraceae bacterium]
MRSRTRLIAGVLVAVAAGGAVVALGVALLLGNIVHLRATAKSTLSTGSYLAATINVEREVVDAETGLRGYVITGKPLFLAPTQTARRQLPTAAVALEQAAKQEGAYVARANALANAARAYTSDYVPGVIAEVTSDPSAARSVATTTLGKQLVDGIRLQTQQLEQLISERQAARQRAARSSANTAVTVAVVVLIVLTLLTLALGGFLGWLVVGRERARERAEALYRRSEHTARILQESLLPTTIPEVPSCELAIRFLPAGAGDLVGGDFYDVFPVADGRWAVVLGDVCGKGAAAATITAMARWTLRSFAGSARSPAEVLRALNDTMRRHDPDGRFITIVYALLSVGGDEAHVTVACAGHPPAIFVSDVGEPETLGAHGDLLGIWPEVRLDQVDVRLGPGDSLVLYSDGVTDQGPGSDGSPEHALRAVTAAPTADGLADALRAEAERVSLVTRDDVAVVVVRYVGTGAGRDRARPPAPAHRAGLTVGQPRA